MSERAARLVSFYANTTFTLRGEIYVAGVTAMLNEYDPLVANLQASGTIETTYRRQRARDQPATSFAMFEVIQPFVYLGRMYNIGEQASFDAQLNDVALLVYYGQLRIIATPYGLPARPPSHED